MAGQVFQYAITESIQVPESVQVLLRWIMKNVWVHKFPVSEVGYRTSVYMYTIH